MKPTYPHLLSPIRVGNLTLKNRMISANALPHFLQGPEPFPAEPLIDHVVNVAKNGAAVVLDCSGAALTDALRGEYPPVLIIRMIKSLFIKAYRQSSREIRSGFATRALVHSFFVYFGFRLRAEVKFIRNDYFV